MAGKDWMRKAENTLMCHSLGEIYVQQWAELSLVELNKHHQIEEKYNIVSLNFAFPKTYESNCTNLVRNPCFSTSIEASKTINKTIIWNVSMTVTSLANSPQKELHIYSVTSTTALNNSGCQKVPSLAIIFSSAC